MKSQATSSKLDKTFPPQSTPRSNLGAVAYSFPADSQYEAPSEDTERGGSGQGQTGAVRSASNAVASMALVAPIFEAILQNHTKLSA